MTKPGTVLLLSAAVLLYCSGARAKPLSEKRSDSYYAWHLGLTAGGFALSGAEELIFANHGAGPYWGSFFLDDIVELNFSESASSLSDRLLFATIMAPVFVQMSQGFDTSMGNATLIY